MSEEHPITNDTLSLTPITEFGGPQLEFDFPALLIGVAEYDEGPTGCTVFHFPRTAQAAVDVRGGAHGTLLTDERDRVSAICLAGGSLMGLETATGVTAELFAQRGYATGWTDIPLVSAGIIFDYNLRRQSSVYPDKELGRAALRSAREGWFPLGARGAGRSATVGKGLQWTTQYKGEAGGQGAAFASIGPTRIAVFTVVNAIGAVVDREGKVVRGNYDAETGRRVHYAEGLRERITAGEHAQPEPPLPEGGSTTLTVVVTNQRLTAEKGQPWAVKQLARSVHSSMWRALQPFHTIYDGDVLWAVTTGEVDNPLLDDIAIAGIASELAWDAVLSSVPA
jgi:6-aminohexanoate-oligomer endohydrolase